LSLPERSTSRNPGLGGGLRRRRRPPAELSAHSFTFAAVRLYRSPHGPFFTRCPPSENPYAETGYNRTAAKVKEWAGKFGGRTAATPKAAAEGQDFVMCCVGNDNDLRAVTLGADGAFAGMKKGATFVDHTTASAEVARELSGAADKAGSNSSTLRCPAARPAPKTAY